MANQRLQKYREKLKNDENTERLENYRQKQKEYDRKYALKQRRNAKTAAKYRKRMRDNKRNQRKKLKDVNKSLEQESSFSSKSARSKALAKTVKSLPKAVAQQEEIISLLSIRHNINTCIHAKNDLKITRKSLAVTTLEKNVHDFFCLDLISRQLPGIRDFIITQDDKGEKQKVQKRNMLMTLKEAHKEFLNMFNDCSISFSKFCKLRPTFVQLFTSEIHHSCGCIYCSNMQLKLDAMEPFLQLKSIDELMIKVNCHRGNFECASGICMSCLDIKNILSNLMSEYHSNELLKFKEWRKVDGYVQKVAINDMTIANVLSKLTDEITGYKIHYYLKKVQQNMYALSKSTQSSDSATIVVDYSENYSTKSQFEVQSSYFGRHQISLFTCAAYIGQDFEENYLIASDDIAHTKEQVNANVKKILIDLKSKFPSLKSVIIFSDGAAGQFKNRFNLGNLIYAREDFGLEIEWHFFVTSHGKSSADGIGGIVKRGVHYRVLSGKWEVYNAAQFVECAKSFVEKINVMEVSPNDYIDDVIILQKRWKTFKNIPGIRECHCFIPLNDFGVLCFSKSSQLDGKSTLKILKRGS